MRWRQQAALPEEAVDDVARSLDAAAAEAPVSPRAAEIRATLLAGLEDAASPRPSYALALAAAVLLAVVLAAVGAPAIGSYVERLGDVPPPAEPLPVPAPDDPVATAKVLDGSAKGSPAVSASASPSQAPVAPVAATQAPTAAVATPAPSASPSPTPQPVDPPGVLPTPPVPLPTPPVIPGP